MSCEESPYVVVGFSWPGPHAIITPLAVYDTYTGRVRADGRDGYIRDFNVVEGIVYYFPDAPSPFSLEILEVFKGASAGTSFIDFRSCDEEVEEEPPSDLLGLLRWVKDLIISILSNVIGISTTIGFFNEIIASTLNKVDDIKTSLSTYITSMNYSFDAFEIWIDDLFDNWSLWLDLGLSDLKRDIIDRIDNIPAFDPAGILEDLKTEIRILGLTISDEVISKLWKYIEDHIFEEDK